MSADILQFNVSAQRFVYDEFSQLDWTYIWTLQMWTFQQKCTFHERPSVQHIWDIHSTLVSVWGSRYTLSGMLCCWMFVQCIQFMNHAHDETTSRCSLVIFSTARVEIVVLGIDDMQFWLAVLGNDVHLHAVLRPVDWKQTETRLWYWQGMRHVSGWRL